MATTTQVADLVREVGGGRVSVDGMLRPGGDPHEYEPRPSDVAAVARADVVFRSGGEVDDWLGDVIDDAGGDAQVVSLIDSGGTGSATTPTGGRTRATRSGLSRPSARA